MNSSRLGLAGQTGQIGRRRKPVGSVKGSYRGRPRFLRFCFIQSTGHVCPGAHRQLFGHPLEHHRRLPAQPQRDPHLRLIPGATCEPCGKRARERRNRSMAKKRVTHLADGYFDTLALDPGSICHTAFVA